MMMSDKHIKDILTELIELSKAKIVVIDGTKALVLADLINTTHAQLATLTADLVRVTAERDALRAARDRRLAERMKVDPGWLLRMAEAEGGPDCTPDPTF
jgi:hypothetical protein